MALRIENMEFNDVRQTIFALLMKLMQNPDQQAIVRVPDVDAANQMKDFLIDCVDRIKIEFDGSERGPNPLWTPSKLVESGGKVDLKGAYGQTSHQDKSITVKR